MKERRIFLWMGLVIVLFSVLILGAPASAEQQYVVKRGDTLSKIAKKHGVSIARLREANGLSGSALKYRQVLVVPSSKVKKVAKAKRTERSERTSYVVRKGDTISSIADKTGCSMAEIKRWNKIRANKIRTGQRLALYRPAPARDVPAERDAASSADEEDELVDEAVDGDVLVLKDPDSDTSSDYLGTWNSSDERSLFVKVAKGFLGAPYRFGGSSVRGIDCSAFVRKVYEVFDVPLPRTAREQAKVGVRVSRDELQEGDLVFFNTRRAFGHVGIYIGNNQFVHASSSRRSREVKIDSLDKPYYTKRFVKAVRLKDLENKDGV